MLGRGLSEILDEYTENLVSGTHSDTGFLGEFTDPDDKQLVTDLVQLTNDLAALLVPVKPSPEFVRQLKTNLAAAAAPSQVAIGRRSKKKLWIWLGAILSGSLVSAAGVLVVWLMRRGRSGAVAAG